MNKNILAIIASILIVGAAIFYIGIPEENESANLTGNNGMAELIDCLAENDLVIYGAEWCPACTRLVESLGGYDMVDSIYVECSIGTEKERERCREEAKTDHVPEIQIDGEVYQGPNDPQSLAQEVGCEF